jgi:ADP-ribose pyrophosphatase YjhB (NUDIX family)
VEERGKSDNLKGVLVSFRLSDTEVPDERDVTRSFGCSIVVLAWGGMVLMGFHGARQRWELPGGSIEVGESAVDAARRELFEETGIWAHDLSFCAHAEFMFENEGKVWRAAIFVVAPDSEPVAVGSDELERFMWWDPEGSVGDETSHLDAEIVRRCLSHVV